MLDLSVQVECLNDRLSDPFAYQAGDIFGVWESSQSNSVVRMTT